MIHAGNDGERVLIVDDKRPARQGLKALLARIPEIDVVCEAVNEQEAVALIGVHRPDVVLIYIHMLLWRWP